MKEWIVEFPSPNPETWFEDGKIKRELVRCIDCKYAFFKEGLVAVGRVFCTKPGTERGQAVKTDVWFCADGRRKDD